MSYSKQVSKNYADRDRKSDGHIKYDSEKYIELVAGTPDVSIIKLDDKDVKINCGTSCILIKKSGDIEIEAAGKLNLTSKGGAIALEADEVTIGAKAKTDLKYAPIAHKYLRIG